MFLGHGCGPATSTWSTSPSLERGGPELVKSGARACRELKYPPAHEWHGADRAGRGRHARPKRSRRCSRMRESSRRCNPPTSLTRSRCSWPRRPSSAAQDAIEPRHRPPTSPSRELSGRYSRHELDPGRGRPGRSPISNTHGDRPSAIRGRVEGSCHQTALGAICGRAQVIPFTRARPELLRRRAASAPDVRSRRRTP